MSIEQLIQLDFSPGSTSFIVIAGVSVSFTLTGATITLTSPAGENYLFQIGDGEALSYYDVRDQFVGATTDDPLASTASAICPTAFRKPAPPTINVITSEVDDVVTVGGIRHP